jgi:hypothetical protein
MSTRSRLGIPLACAVGIAVLVALPAHADTCALTVTCPTTINVTVTGGALTITVPNGPVAVGSGAAGTQVSGLLGGITVLDQRAALAATWVSSVTATALTTGGSTGAETIPNTAILYWSGPATATTGTGTFVPGQADAAAAQSMDTSRTAFSKTTGSGNNSATWNPTLVTNVPAQAVMGTYTGTVSHSVA